MKLFIGFCFGLLVIILSVLAFYFEFLLSGFLK